MVDKLTAVGTIFESRLSANFAYWNIMCMYIYIYIYQIGVTSDVYTNLIVTRIVYLYASKISQQPSWNIGNWYLSRVSISFSKNRFIV